MLISAERLWKYESVLLLLIPSQHDHCTDQWRRTQVETWNGVIINAQTETKQSVSGARNWISPRWIMPAKCLFPLLGSMLPSHNNIRGHSLDGEKADIGQAGPTNKSKVYLATCGPAGYDMAVRSHEVLSDSVWCTIKMKSTEAWTCCHTENYTDALSEIQMNGNATAFQSICDPVCVCLILIYGNYP